MLFAYKGYTHLANASKPSLRVSGLSDQQELNHPPLDVKCPDFLPRHAVACCAGEQGAVPRGSCQFPVVARGSSAVG